ncbi:MAG: hypothetical protein RL199_627 [Pseudomonadota bacterium]|jgi:hypothetical protein
MSDIPQTTTIQIQLDEETAQGTYANLVITNHGETEFTLDFVFLQPQQPRAKVRSRVLLAPLQAKRFAAALQEGVAKYEARFGAIDASRPGPGDISFH